VTGPASPVGKRSITSVPSSPRPGLSSADTNFDLAASPSAHRPVNAIPARRVSVPLEAQDRWTRLIEESAAMFLAHCQATWPGGPLPVTDPPVKEPAHDHQGHPLPTRTTDRCWSSATQTTSNWNSSPLQASDSFRLAPDPRAPAGAARPGARGVPEAQPFPAVRDCEPAGVGVSQVSRGPTSAASAGPIRDPLIRI
jgi:hypothetical protein